MVIYFKNNPVNGPLIILEQRAIVDQIIEEHRDKPESVMAVLVEVQRKIGYVSEPTQTYLADELKVSDSTINAVVAFYSFLITNPRGKYAIKFSMDTANYVAGIRQLLELISRNMTRMSNHGSVQPTFTPIRDILRNFSFEMESIIRLKACPSGAYPMFGKRI